MKKLEKKHIELVRKKLKLNTRSKVINIHHIDLDGVGSSIIIKNSFRNPRYINAKYNNIDEILLSIDYNNIDAVILTDISSQKAHEKLGKIWNEKVLLLDHHDTAVHLHDPDNMKFVIPGECGTTLAKKFFEMYYNTGFDYLDYLSYVINDYDMWYHKDPKSKQLNELYLKYWDDNFRERFSKGFTDFNFEEKIYLKNQKNEFNKIYNNLDTWELEDINGVFFVNQKWTNEICDKLMDEHGYQIAINKNPKTKSCSVRSRIKDIHIGELLKELGFGGGHAEAAGFYEPDIIKFQEKIQTLERELKDRLEKGK